MKKKKESVVLNEAVRNAFHQLKNAVMSAPVLACPDPNKEYLLETDTSKLDLGAMLYQKQSDGRYHPVAFWGRALHGAKVDYYSTRLEFLAMKWSIKHFQTYLLGCSFKVCTDNNLLTYFLTSQNMDATKQQWINELVKYDFSLKYQKGKNNTMADALSRISEEWLSDKEADKLLKTVPLIPGDDTMVEIFEEEESEKKPERSVPYMMSLAAIKAVFDNLTSGAGRRAEQGYNTDSAAHREVDSIKVNVRSARLSTQIHAMDWVEAQHEDPEIETAMDWCQLDRRKSEPWTKQLMKLKSRLGFHKNTPMGKSMLRNADRLILCGGLLYHRHTLKYQIEEVKCFIVPKAHRRTAIDGCHQDAGHQDKKRTESYLRLILMARCP